METIKIHEFSSPIVSVISNSTATRIAVLTSDSKISFLSLNKFKKYQLEGQSSQIILENESLQIKFAPVDFGSIIAVSDNNGCVSLYEETLEKITGRSSWKKIKDFSFSNEKITDFKFGPTFFPFRLAITSSFGILRIFECKNTLDFSEWELICEKLVSAQTKGIKSFSWCKNPFNPPMIAVLSEENDPKSRKIPQETTSEINIFMNNGNCWKIMETNFVQDHCRDYSEYISWGTSLGKSNESLVCSGNDGVFFWDFEVDEEKIKIRFADRIETDGENNTATHLSWNPHGTNFISSDDSNSLFLYSPNGNRWFCNTKCSINQ